MRESYAPAYGVEVNNSSISLRVEFPATRAVQRADDRSLLDTPNTKSLILGADAQTLSWSYADTDFPVLAASDTAAAKGDQGRHGLRPAPEPGAQGVAPRVEARRQPRARRADQARAHARLERRGGGSYRFPHTVSQELIREAIEPTTTSGAPHPPDWELGIFYTSDTTTAGTKLGSFAVVIGPGQRSTWRMLDATASPIDLATATRWTG
jgi:competence protein ComEC